MLERHEEEEGDVKDRKNHSRFPRSCPLPRKACQCLLGRSREWEIGLHLQGYTVVAAIPGYEFPWPIFKGCIVKFYIRYCPIQYRGQVIESKVQFSVSAWFVLKFALQR